MQVRIRQAEPADRDQLAQLREALCPKISAAEHARELEPILGGDTPGIMPLINFVAETADATLIGFSEVDLRSHADGCDPARSVGYLEGWYVTEAYAGAVSAADFLLSRKIGHGATAASRWRPTHGSTTSFRKDATKRWASKSLTDAPTIAKGYKSFLVLAV